MRKQQGNGECEMWLMVDQDGRRTLFKLIEVENGGDEDVARLARVLHARAVVVDVALPNLPALDQPTGVRRRSEKSRLIHLNVRTVPSEDATGVVVGTPARLA